MQTDMFFLIPERKERFIITVASVLHCGMRWTLKVAKNCGFHPNKLNAWRKDVTEFFLGGFKVDELEEGSWEHTAAGRSAVNSILRFANWMISWWQETTHHLGERRKMCFPMIYSHGVSGKVLVFTAPIISEVSPPPGTFYQEALVPSCLL
jgi:hypothetical protein